MLQISTHLPAPQYAGQKDTAQYKVGNSQLVVGLSLKKRDWHREHISGGVNVDFSLEHYHPV